MSFSKRFPKNQPTSPYPQWVEVALSESEEERIESTARADHISLMRECLDDAYALVRERKLKEYQTNVVQLAIAFFEKRTSHVVYYKEEYAKKIFDERFS